MTGNGGGWRGVIDPIGERDMQSSRDVHIPRLLRATGAWGWRFLAAAAALYILLNLLTRLAIVVVPVLVALFLASILEPLVQWLSEHHVPRLAAASLVFLAAVLGLAGLLWWFGTSISDQFGQLGRQLLQAVSQLEQWLTNGPLALSQQQVRELENQLTSVVDASEQGLLRNVVGRVRTAVELIGAVALTVFLLFMVMYDGRRMGQWLVDRLPRHYRDDAIAIGSRTQTVMHQFLLAVGVTGLLDAVLIAVALMLIGVPLVLPLAVLTFFGAFFPVIGAFVAGLVSAVVALVSGGWRDALLVVAATIFVQQMEANVFQPFILGRGVRLHPAVTAVTVAAGLILAGLIGAFLAVPLVATVTQVASYYAHRE